jgi:predicted phage-related endonuclease
MMATNMIHFDTLQYVKTLEASGVSPEQAEAMTRAQQVVFSQCIDTTFATKEDIKVLRKETKQDIQELREETKQEVQSIKEDIQVLREDLHTFKIETKEDIQSLKSDVNVLKTEVRWIRWFLGLNATGIGTLLLKAFI